MYSVSLLVEQIVPACHIFLFLSQPYSLGDDENQNCIYGSSLYF